tara:strand:- start:67 stop:399 length:333 start_codon:yes stop_codon:yes gene_type:complete
MSWRDIIKDSKAANQALEMDFFMKHLKDALEYETQDIEFADFGNKQKVLDIAEKGKHNLMAVPEDFMFETIDASDAEATFRVSRGKLAIKVVFDISGEKVQYRLKEPEWN